MRTLTPVELLEVWEAGTGQPTTERALLLLSAACPEVSGRELATLSIGARDAELLRLRERLWGSWMIAVAQCPGCEELLEIGLDTRELLAEARALEAGEAGEAGELRLSVGGYDMHLRLPTSEDAMAASKDGGVEAWESSMLERCVLSVTHDEVAVAASGLPEEVLTGLNEYLAEADPLADIQLDLTCVSCGHRWQSAFDVVSFLWTEVEAWALGLLAEVHTLARAYGWAEGEILSLGNARRQFYLEMVGA